MIGTRLGPYEITAKLGEGGMGEVYRATDTKLKREVAIKVLPAAFTADAERLKRFEREAQVLAQLHHPHVASIFGFEESGGIRALVMELVEGPTLAERLAEGAFSVEESVAVALQVAQALEAAHERGIVHRDLKPQNIKAPIDGRVKVLDFGLAKAIESGRGGGSGAASASQLEHSPTITLGGTEIGMILGTAAYMAPEQAKGLAVDKRADVWAFGVVLYEMLTGRRLFAADTVPETLAGVIRADIDLSALPARTPPFLRRLLARCLERNPRDRLRDIGEARFALEHPEPAPVAVPRPNVHGSRARWLRFAAIAALALAVGVGIGALMRRGPKEPAVASELRITPITSSGNVISASISPDGRYVAYVESEQGMQSLWLLQLSGGQTLRLIPDRPVFYWGHSFTRDGNSIYFAQKSDGEPRGALYSISTLGGVPTRLLTEIDSAVTFSPSGREMAFLRAEQPTVTGSALVVAQVDGSNQRVLASFELPEYVAGIFFAGPAWSPDGKRIATAVARRGGDGAEGRARLALVSVGDGAVTSLADPGWAGAAQAAWLPDGKSLLLIAISRDQPSPQIWSVTHPGGEARRLTSDLSEHRIVSLTADGSTMVSVAGAYTSSVWSAPLGGAAPPRKVSRSSGDGMFGVGFTPDGKVLYSSFLGRAWSVWSVGLDAADRTPILTLSDEPTSGFALRDQGRIGFPVIGTDGTIYFVARNRSGAEIRVAARDGSPSRTVVGDVQFQPFALSPDGRFLVFGTVVAGVPRLQRAAVDGSGREPVFDTAAILPALDPSGTKLAFYHFDAESRPRLGVRALAGGRLLLDLPAESPGFGSRLVLREEGLYLNTVRGDRANVWLLPTGGGPPRRVTSFDDEWVVDFAVSSDGKTLAVARGPRLRDAQLITGLRGVALEEQTDSSGAAVAR